MNGLRRIAFAGLAALLRVIARAPLWLGEVISAGADWCDERASPRDGRGS